MDGVTTAEAAMTTFQPFVPENLKPLLAEYQLSEFRAFFDRVNIRGKRVLEVGSDYHLAIARLMSANGAAHVTTTNIGNWRTSDVLPHDVEFLVGDVADLPLPARSFDIVYGVAVLEHVPDLEKTAAAIARVLKRDGTAFLQGCPLWPGRLGHHAVVMKGAADFDPPLAPGAPVPFDTLYEFSNDAKNPIPDWAHLSWTPEQMKGYLVSQKISLDHAERIVAFVYGSDKHTLGSYSNFRSASDITKAFRRHFRVEIDPLVDTITNEYYKAALAKYSDMDLRTLGLRLWLTPRGTV